jgi:hypothetical protein
LLHKVGEWYSGTALQGITDEIYPEVGIAVTLSNRRFGPRIKYASDMFLERAMPVSVVIPNRRLVAQAGAVA